MPAAARVRAEPFHAPLFLAIFFTFGGFYVAMMLASNGVIPVPTRYLAIPIRVLIVSILLGYFLRRAGRVQPAPTTIFVGFSLVYLVRVLYEAMYHPDSYNMPSSDFALYFLSFTFLPLLMVSRIRFTAKMYDAVFLGLIVSSILFGVTTCIFYGDLIGEVGRISSAVKKDENYISPLALSYGATMGAGVGFAYLLTNRVSTFRRYLLLACIAISLAPFFLGASRGSLIALVFPLLVFAAASKGAKMKVGLVAATLTGAAMLYLASFYMGDVVFRRFMGIQEAVDQGSSSAVRLDVWADAAKQFMESPLVGDSLNSRLINNYPHNVILESLITTGVIGAVPFFIFLWMCLRRSYAVARSVPHAFWIPVIFLQGLAQHLFSGAIYSMAWLAMGAGLLISLGPVERQIGSQHARRAQGNALHRARMH